MKHILNKNKVLEFFDPILNGSTIQNPTGYQTGSNASTNPLYVASQQGSDMIEKPFWLTDDVEASSVRNGDIESLATIYLNGIPISPWSAMQGGNMVGQQKKDLMNNWYYVDALTKHLFPNGILSYLNKDGLEEIKITKLSILRMIPSNTGIGFSIHIKFNLNDSDELDDLESGNEIWAKFLNVGVDINPKFVCEDIEKLKKEDQIKIQGRVWNTLLNWFKPKSGIYTCIAKHVLVYTELGQLKNVVAGDIIEVISSDNETIKFRLTEQIFTIKKPNYYWFNYYFQIK